MSLKAKLISSISAFVLVLTILIVSVWAVSQTQVPLGGTINFQATNVYAKVSATVSGMDENPILPTLTFSEGEGASSEEDIEKWNDLNLVFNSSATPIEISVTVENLSEELSLGVSITNQIASIENVNISITKNDEEAASAIVAPAESATFVLTISLENVNVSVQETLYEFLINLTDASQMREINVYSNVEGTNVSGSGLYAIGDTVTISAAIDELGTIFPLGIASDSNYENFIYKFDLSSIFASGNIQPMHYSFVLTEDSPSYYYCLYLDTATDKTYQDASSSGSTYGLTFTYWDEYAFVTAYKGSPLEEVTHLDFPNTVTIEGKEYKVIGTFGGRRSNALTYLYPNLESIHIPENLQFIVIGSMFYYLPSVKEITISSANKSLSDMGMNVIYDKVSKTVLSGCSTSEIPEEATKIGVSAFEACTNLTSINIPEGVTEIGIAAFGNCSSLTSISIPEGVTSIGDSAFFYCKQLKEITIPESVASIGDDAFYGCENLTSVALPSALTEIGDSAFRECFDLTSITINGDIKNLSSSVFFACSKLTKLTLDEGVTELPDNLFTGYNLTKLTEIVVEGDSSFSGALPGYGKWVKDEGSETVENFSGAGTYTRTDI